MLFSETSRFVYWMQVFCYISSSVPWDTEVCLCLLWIVEISNLLVKRQDIDSCAQFDPVTPNQPHVHFYPIKDKDIIQVIISTSCLHDHTSFKLSGLQLIKWMFVFICRKSIWAVAPSLMSTQDICSCGVERMMTMSSTTTSQTAKASEWFSRF